MRPSPGAKKWHIYSTRRGKRSENLSKDQFGVLAKGTLRKLYSRIEAPWPELIEGVCPLVHQMLNERRELHKIVQQATHLLSIHCLYQTPEGSARGFVKKVDEGDSWEIWGRRMRLWAALLAGFRHFGFPAARGAHWEKEPERPSLPESPIFQSSGFPWASLSACAVDDQKQP
jgi:hypothetical protein